jgi:hypothetical protein
MNYRKAGAQRQILRQKVDQVSILESLLSLL